MGFVLKFYLKEIIYLYDSKLVNLYIFIILMDSNSSSIVISYLWYLSASSNDILLLSMPIVSTIKIFASWNSNQKYISYSRNI